MIDPAILRAEPERYAREPWLQATLTGPEREYVQGVIADRFCERRDEEARRARVLRMPAAYGELSGRWTDHRRKGA